MGTGGSFLRVQQLGHVNDHAPPSSAGVKNEWRDTSTPHIHLHRMPMDNLTFIAEIYPHTTMKNLTVVPICQKENEHLIYKTFFSLLIYSIPKNVSVLTHISIFQRTFYTSHNQNFDSAGKQGPV